MQDDHTNHMRTYIGMLGTEMYYCILDTMCEIDTVLSVLSLNMEIRITLNK